MRPLVIAFALALVFGPAALGAAESADDAARAHAEQLEQWRASRFGMFIHWGPSSLTGNEISWSRGQGKSAEEYDRLYERFNPTNYVAAEWVSIAKAAGMKYMVFTARHHDGFSMFDTKADDHKITNPKSPFRRDVVKELADATRSGGMPLGIYYSQPNWHYPKDASPKFEDYLREQLRELLTNYGRIELIWFDGLGSAVDPKNLHAMMRGLQPQLLINNRNGSPEDFDTPEQTIGGFNNSRPWESCITICHQWSWKPNDGMKSLKECIHTLVFCAGGDGNLLLNVGPMPDGRIEPRQVERLKEIGRWLGKYGESIYATRGGPFKPNKLGVLSTHREKTVYLHVLNWPVAGLTLPAIPAKIIGSSALTGGAITVKQTDNATEISLPESDRQEIDTIIKLELDSPATKMTPLSAVVSGSLAFGKKAAASNVYGNQTGYRADMAFDDDPTIRWATDAGTKSAWLDVDLGEPKKMGRAVIHEAYGRIKAYELQAEVDGRWQTFHSGTTLGEHAVLEFKPVTAQRIRLNVLDAADGPTICEFHVFKP